ncbi:transcriptional regulator swi6 [Coelomomyces lativittatus]|nr:transcriptional regulator swi6 [Coelomomyces lativittatus]
MLMAMFLAEDTSSSIPTPSITPGSNHPDSSISTPPSRPPFHDLDLSFDLEIVLDPQGHTPLHWAAALARTHIVDLLISRGAHVQVKNYEGETPLMRAVMVTNNYDQRAFPTLLVQLHDSIGVTDHLSRTVLHRIVHTCEHATSHASAYYYLRHVLDHVQQTFSAPFVPTFLGLQDHQGQTVLQRCWTWLQKFPHSIWLKRMWQSIMEKSTPLTQTPTPTPTSTTTTTTTTTSTISTPTPSSSTSFSKSSTPLSSMGASSSFYFVDFVQWCTTRS